MNGLRALLVVLGATAFESTALAQAELWTDLGVRAEVADGLRLELSERLRLDDDFSHWSGALTTLSLDYRLHRMVRIGGGYRLSVVPDNDGVTRARHRLHVQAAGVLRLGPVRGDLRFRFQEQFRVADDNGTTLRHFIRTRLRFTLRGGWAKPFILGESFHRLAHDDVVGYLDAVRLAGGAKFDVGDDTLSAIYYFEHSFSDDTNAHIVALRYRFDL